jgi:hypothetical protein
MVAQIPHQRSDRDVHGEPPFAPTTWQTRWSASTTWQTQGFAPTTWQTQGSAPTIRHSLLATRCSLFANRQSLPFSVVADSLMADTRVCPYHSLIATRYSLPFFQSPVANHQSLPFSPVAAVLAIRYSPLAIRCRFSSRQSLIAIHCRPRQSLIASRCYHPCDFFPSLRIQPSQQPTGLIG